MNNCYIVLPPNGDVVESYELVPIPAGEIIHAPQGSDAWKAIRRTGLTASKSAEYCGCSKDGSPSELSRQMIDNPNYEPPDPQGNMAKGRKYENPIALAFCSLLGMGTEVETVDMVKHVDFARNQLMISPDRRISAGPMRGIYVEVKFSQYRLFEDMPKVPHVMQCHMQMNVAGIDWLYLIYGHRYKDEPNRPWEYAIWLLKRYPPLWAYMTERMERFRRAVFEEHRYVHVCGPPLHTLPRGTVRDESNDEIPNLGHAVTDCWKRGGHVPMHEYDLYRRFRQLTLTQIEALFPPIPPYELLYSSTSSGNHVGPLFTELLLLRDVVEPVTPPPEVLRT